MTYDLYDPSCNFTYCFLAPESLRTGVCGAMSGPRLKRLARWTSWTQDTSILLRVSDPDLLSQLGLDTLITRLYSNATYGSHQRSFRFLARPGRSCGLSTLNLVSITFISEAILNHEPAKLALTITQSSNEPAFKDPNRALTTSSGPRYLSAFPDTTCM